MEFENPLWQSAAWEKFQARLSVQTFQIDEVLIIERQTAFQKRFFEIPQVKLASVPESFWEKLETLGKKRNVVFTRVFPADHRGHHKEIPLPTSSKNIPEFFPRDTLVLDLHLSEEEILAAMKQKGRYNIALAQKKGVKILQSDDTSEFFRILQETTSRDGFSGHPETTYRAMLESFGKDGLLLVAEYEGEIIAGGIFLFCEGVCTYYYGASSNRHRNLMAPYLVQWEAIREAKTRNCRFYDFLGIAPENANEAHPLFGVSQFKEKFGGIRIKYSPAFEIIHRNGWHRFLRTAKKIRGVF